MIAPLKLLPRKPLDAAKVTHPRGKVNVIPERCKGCNFCVKFCPESTLALSDDMNTKGYHYAVVAAGKEGTCVNCGFCAMVCPEFAIYTVPA